jgi:hypothetical protein
MLVSFECEKGISFGKGVAFLSREMFYLFEPEKVKPFQKVFPFGARKRFIFLRREKQQLSNVDFAKLRAFKNNLTFQCQ